MKEVLLPLILSPVILLIDTALLLSRPPSPRDLVAAALTSSSLMQDGPVTSTIVGGTCGEETILAACYRIEMPRYMLFYSFYTYEYSCYLTKEGQKYAS
jgi:hypothetical protein